MSEILIFLMRYFVKFRKIKKSVFPLFDEINVKAALQYHRGNLFGFSENSEGLAKIYIGSHGENVKIPD